jgi:putative two-component system response regulator
MHQPMNTQVDPLKIAITKQLKRDALNELRVQVAAGTKDISNVQIDDLERRAVALMEGHEITPELIDTIVGACTLFYRTANSERGLYIAEWLREFAEKNGFARTASMLPLLNSIGLCASDVSDNANATDALNAGLGLAEELENKYFQVVLMTSLGLVSMQAGMWAEGLRVYDSAIDLASDDPNQICNIIACEANSLYANLLLGRYEAAISIITTRSRPESMPSGNESFFRVFFEANAAQIYAEAGFIDEAKKHLALARGLVEKYKASRAAMAFEMAEGLVTVYEKDFKAGLLKMESVLTKARRVGDAWHDYLPVVARAYEYAGQPQEALRYTRALIDFRTAAQEKNILRYARRYQPARDACSGEAIADEAPTILARLLTRAQILEGQVAKIELMNERQKSFRQRTEMLERMAVMTSLRDDASGERVYRVGRLASLLTHMLGEDDHTVFMMEMAARLHDIGKISIPDIISQKATAFSAVEHDMMKMHTVIGAELLAKSEITELQMAEQIARYHHEHWDGSGYPEGLKGEAIPLPARVVALADVFDALTHARTYRTAFTIDAAIEEINKGCGTQFEPRLVDPFIKLIQLLRYEQIADEHGNVPANLDDLLGQSAKASPLLLARQKIWASIDSVSEAKLSLPQLYDAENAEFRGKTRAKNELLLSKLTLAEREVVNWISKGKTNPEIAQILGSSKFTVKTHVQRVYSKLGVNSRVTLSQLLQS